MTNHLNPQDFDAFRAGDLSPELHQAFQSHIAGCDVCRGEFVVLQHLDDEIKAAHLEITPRTEWIANLETLLNADSARVVTKGSKQTRQFRPLIWLATAAMLLVTASLAVWNFSPPEKKASTPTIKSNPESILSGTPQFATNASAADIQKVTAKEPAVLAQGDFLVGRHPKSDDDIELYWVLPIRHKQ
jgi:hypothetical protein